ncbi:uncharacterized protein PG986_005169 [Apiospora aurea]|uniref:Glycosyltransferase family 2 protein n=1 Tax=Apiospora aurea TaxID=335848 RepID=A0ABR1QHL7_9PEZI
MALPLFLSRALAVPGWVPFLAVITVTLPYCFGVKSFLGWWPLTAEMAFAALFLFRHWRTIMQFVGRLIYRPSPVPSKPTYLPSKDVTVVMPTIDPATPTFRRCLKSICASAPACIFVVTIGNEKYRAAKAALGPVRSDYPEIEIQVRHTLIANKRAQINSAIDSIGTSITLLVDDSAIWPTRFLSNALAPFEDPEVGLVGTEKLVERLEKGTLWQRFWNYLGATYLARHNWELMASSAIDGGLFIVSGRTAGIRTSILKDPEFRRGYMDEHILFTFPNPFLVRQNNFVFTIGPIAADDDNYIHRWCVDHGIKAKFQADAGAGVQNHGHGHEASSSSSSSSPSSVVGIAGLGEYPRFLQQCLRWARTTFRSNPRMLLSPRAWRQHPWSMYGVQAATLTNFALAVDYLQLDLFRRTAWYANMSGLWWVLAGWILFSGKGPKLYPWYRRYPADILFFPGSAAFGYWHSLIKAYALLTFWNVKWEGRDLDTINRQAQTGEEKAKLK